MNLFKIQRKSAINLNEVYFFTATIQHWNKLLLSNSCKTIIVESLEYLSNKDKIDVFAFVIMPNHIHLIWKIKEMKGKETVHTAFLKHTAHAFKKLLLKHNPEILANYAVNAKNKQYQFWQRDSLAVHLYTPEVAYQKLNYIHLNPLAEHWQLALYPSDYFYSSASFMKKDVVIFLF